MAKGPCGEEFKTAFSCFVFSESEPKGADCVDYFKNMQKCFQEYPEYYADQLKDDEDDVNVDVKTESIERVSHNSETDAVPAISLQDKNTITQ